VTDGEREILSLDAIADEPEVGRWLSAMEDARRDTLKELEGVPDDAVDWMPGVGGGGLNSIGTLLYHIALVEADWLLTDIMGPESGVPWPEEWLPYGDRDKDGRLTIVKGETVPQHLVRLRAVRELLLGHLRPMPLEEFHRLRPRERWDVTPAWVLHHLLQHEAEHRAHIAWLRDVRPRV
jgi:Protein of unknown function (DUF664)